MWIKLENFKQKDIEDACKSGITYKPYFDKHLQTAINTQIKRGIKIDDISSIMKTKQGLILEKPVLPPFINLTEQECLSSLTRKILNSCSRLERGLKA